MRSSLARWVTLAAAFTLSCGDATGIDIADLVGTWNASKLEFTSAANATLKADVVGLGGSLSITFASNGSFTLTEREPGELANTRTGTFLLKGDTLTISESGQGSPTDFRTSLSGSTLTLTNDDDEYDFNNDGTEEPARLIVVLNKQ